MRLNTVYNQNALDPFPFPDNSIHCCVTSPPYWGLRDYKEEGQIGHEKTPEEYVEKLVKVFREIKRVLHPSGVAWLNLGSSYAASLPHSVYKPKGLIPIPWLVGIALQKDGWWLRNDVIWHKPNCMPTSATDRLTVSHEYILLLTKSQKYFFDQEAIREPHKQASIKRDKAGYKAAFKGRHTMPGEKRPHSTDHNGFLNPGGRNKRTVWTVSTKGYPEAHFATFNPDLIEPCILAGTSKKGVCPECGNPWERVIEKIKDSLKVEERRGRTGHVGQPPQISGNYWEGPTTKATDKWRPTCNHYPRVKEWQEIPKQDNDESDNDYQNRVQPIVSLRIELLDFWKDLPVVPAVVIDPFMGSGTSAEVAERHGRNWVGIELNPDYIELTDKRLKNMKPKGSQPIVIEHDNGKVVEYTQSTFK